jgi:hypothetical protein
MTTYKQINVTDSWKQNEVHVSRITDTSYGCCAKLTGGRLSVLVLKYKPEESEEPAILKRLIWRDRKKRLSEFWQSIFRRHECEECE